MRPRDRLRGEREGETRACSDGEFRGRGGSCSHSASAPSGCWGGRGPTSCGSAAVWRKRAPSSDWSIWLHEFFLRAFLLREFFLRAFLLHGFLFAYSYFAHSCFMDSYLAYSYSVNFYFVNSYYAHSCFMVSHLA